MGTPLRLSERQREKLQDNLLSWFSMNARELPWRTTPRDPYAVWLSEVMLQQTRVGTVVAYFERFLSRFPDVTSLANASLDDVLALWSGLGYYRRARQLHAAAKVVVDEHASRFPSTAAELQQLPGIGTYTAAAIASLAFNEPIVVVDGNVLRVMARLFNIREPIQEPKTVRELRLAAQSLLTEGRPGAFNEALMELGALVCTPGQPRCDVCPLGATCQAKAANTAGALPVTRAKTPSPQVALTCVLIEHRGQLAMGQRPHDGLFGGLWEPIMIDAKPASKRKLLLKSLVADGNVVPLGELRHVLTHRELLVDVVVGHRRTLPKIATYEQLAWLSASEAQGRGISTLTRRVLELWERSKP